VNIAEGEGEILEAGAGVDPAEVSTEKETDLLMVAIDMRAEVLLQVLHTAENETTIEMTGEVHLHVMDHLVAHLPQEMVPHQGIIMVLHGEITVAHLHQALQGDHMTLEGRVVGEDMMIAIVVDLHHQDKKGIGAEVLTLEIIRLPIQVGLDQEKGIHRPQTIPAQAEVRGQVVEIIEQEEGLVTVDTKNMTEMKGGMKEEDMNPLQEVLHVMTLPHPGVTEEVLMIGEEDHRAIIVKI